MRWPPRGKALLFIGNSNNNQKPKGSHCEKSYAGIDLHSNNLVIGLIDREGKRLVHGKLDCELKKVLEFLEPYKERLEKVAVESTYNWYWLVDGLAAAGYEVEKGSVPNGP